MNGNTEGSKHTNNKNSSRVHHAWLHQQVQYWLADNLVSPAQGDAIASRYPLPSQPLSWGKIIVSAFGAIILGLGVILVFAYNWQGMHRWSKLLLVLVALCAAHAVGWRLRFFSSQDRPGAHALGESFHLLGSMLFGAGIWLVAQIYHIDSHYPNGILLWALGSLAMAWALQSGAQALLALALICLWGVFEMFDFQNPDYGAFWLIALGVAPLAWLKRSPLLLVFTSVLLAGSYLVSTFQLHEQWMFAAIISLAIIYVLGARILADSELMQARTALAAIGWLVYFTLLFAVTFGDFGYTREAQPLPDSAWLTAHILLPCFAAFALLIWFFYRLPSFRQRYEQITVALLALTFLLVIGAHLAWIDFGLVLIMSNLILLGHGCVFLVKGMHLLDWRRVAVGGVVLAGLVFARFMDLFDNLLVRALVFMALGAALLALGWLFSRCKSDSEERADA